MKLKKIISLIIPPVFYKILPRKYGYMGNYKSWEDAVKHSDGYASDIIVKKVVDSSAKVRDGLATFERDTILYEKVRPTWHILSWLLYVSIKNNNELNIVDFGGSLGTSYYQSINYLKDIVTIRWNIVEQKKLVDEGRKKFSNKNFSFYYTVEEALNVNKANVILISGSLHYIEKPYEFLKKIVELKFDYILFDKVPVFLKNEPDRICVQKVFPEIFKASLPMHIFNKDTFLKNFEGYKMVGDIEYNSGLAKGVCYAGYLFEKLKNR